MSAGPLGNDSEVVRDRHRVGGDGSWSRMWPVVRRATPNAVLSTLKSHTRDGIVDMSSSCSAVGLHEAGDLVRLHGDEELRLEMQRWQIEGNI